jgi:hypothetical protein
MSSTDSPLCAAANVEPPRKSPGRTENSCKDEVNS